ncbi:MAG: ABC transporter permease [Cyclobacteriaceae bacterium]
MLKNYLIVTFRNLRKQKTYSIINVLGLTLSIASSLLLLLYVTDELSYDRYHENADRIYRIAMNVQMGAEERKVAVAPAAIAPTLSKNYADVENFAIIRPINDFKVIQNGQTFSQADAFCANASVFDVFTFPLLSGDSQTALEVPNSIVIDQQMAERYFPNQEAVGQTLLGEDSLNYLVTGVMENVQYNGHFTPQVLVSIWDEQKTSSWNDWNWANYVKLAPNAEIGLIEQSLGTVYEDHLEERLTEMNGGATFVLQPLTDIHFHSQRDFELRVNDGNMDYIYIFLTVACLLLLVSSVNYLNLATARSLRRAKEVGVRKALGSTKSQLVRQFLTESYLLIGISVVLGIGLALILIPTFQQFTGKTVSLSSIMTPISLIWAIIFFILLGLIAGGYPAFVLSRFNSVKALKGVTFGQSSTGVSLRQALVIFQFVVSVTMLISTLVIFRQLLFVNQQSLGFSPEQVITIGMSNEDQRKFLPLKTALLQNPNIQQISTTLYHPGEKPEINSFHLESDEGQQDRILQQLWVDHEFLPTLDIQLISGRNFSAREPGDTTRAGVLVNEALVKSMGWTKENALGRRLSSDEWQDKVIGVVSDFHMLSLHNVIEPIVIRYSIPDDWMLVRVNSTNISETLVDIQDTWNQIVGKTELSFHFLDEQFEAQYEKDEKRGYLFSGFSALTVIIACLGLFGLASYSTSQRVKEMGIRKVLGASVAELLTLLVKNYVRLILISLCIAIPIANYFAAEWLTNFAYQTDIAWWYFVVPGVALLLIALLSISQQTYWVATKNPSDSLRDE